jgi:ADP-heptose:LPS heptosyltransferase
MSLISKTSAWSYRVTFSALAKRTPPTARPFSLGEAPRILAFTCAGIGDTLTDSVVFKALKEKWPQSTLAAVVHRRRQFLVNHNPFVDKMFLLQKGPIAFWRLHQRLKKAGPWDAILHLRGNDPEPRCQSWLLDPNITVSTPNMTKMGHLCGHHVVQPDWDETHGVEQTLRLARYLGAETAEPHLVYQVRPEEKMPLENKLDSLWKESSFDPLKPRIVFQIGGGRRAAWRDWPAERYAGLIQNLASKLTAEFILLAGPESVLEKKAVDIINMTQPITVRNAVGRLNLAESAALLASSKILVSTDTGIMHLGFAVGTRVVALIHYRNPSSRVGPYGYGDRHRVHQLAPGSSGMEAITSEEVSCSVQTIWQEEKR